MERVEKVLESMPQLISSLRLLLKVDWAQQALEEALRMRSEALWMRSKAQQERESDAF